MTLDKVNRRTHLYLAMVLLPWFAMFGFSSIPLNHPAAPAVWDVVSEREYHMDPIAPKADMEAIGRRMIADAGLSVPKRFGAFRGPSGVTQVYMSRFLRPLQVKYYPDRNRLVVEARQWRLPNFLTEMHTRAGFDKGDFADHLWVFFVDLTGIATVLWVLSGLYMWWNLRGQRFWGWVAIAAGAATFSLIVMKL